MSDKTTTETLCPGQRVRIIGGRYENAIGRTGVIHSIMSDRECPFIVDFGHLFSIHRERAGWETFARALDFGAEHIVIEPIAPSATPD